MKSDTSGGGGGKGKVSKKYRCDSEAVEGGVWVAAMATAGHVVAASEQTRTHPPSLLLPPLAASAPPYPTLPQSPPGSRRSQPLQKKRPVIVEGVEGKRRRAEAARPRSRRRFNYALQTVIVCVCVWGRCWGEGGGRGGRHQHRC